MKDLTIQDLKDQGLIIYEVLSGSQLYGTNTPESDIDMKGVFVLPLDMILSDQYVEQISDEKNDIVYYELGRYIHLLKSSNPNMLESLFVNEDQMFVKHPIMDRILSVREKFITKECNNSLVGYSRSQIKKSKGLNKMQNWEGVDMKRKGVIDFCYTQYQQGSTLINDWLKHRGLKQEYCGLVEIPNMRYTYGVYYDYAQHLQLEKIEYNSKEFWDLVIHLEETHPTPSWYENFLNSEKNLKYKGIFQKEESNDVSTSAVPKNAEPLTMLIFNKDGYSQFCKIYLSYETWKKERNTSRYVDKKEHGQSYDGKNLMHCVRLLRMGKEIAEGKGYIVKRPDAEYLKSIRKGVPNLDDIISESEKGITEIDELFKIADLPEKIDEQFCLDLCLSMRKEMYGLN